MAFRTACAVLLCAFLTAAAKPGLIIDTDMSTDVDDVGAVCIANAMADAGDVELLAVVHNTGIDNGVAAISALMTYYGREHVPIGAYMGDFDNTLKGPYVDDLANNFPTQVQNRSQVPDAVTVYRQVLAAAENNSVIISSIGFTTNLEGLLKSKGDQHSPLSGVELLKAKGKLLSWMGGKYPSSKGTSSEWNFSANGIGPSTNYTLQHWPAEVPIVFIGWFLGHDVETGGVMTKALPEDNPCRKAYIDYNGPNNNRSSWDPMTTMYAVRGNQGDWSVPTYGENHVNQDGSNYFVADSAHKQQAYLNRTQSPLYIAKLVDDLLLQPPKHKAQKGGRAGSI